MMFENDGEVGSGHSSFTGDSSDSSESPYEEIFMNAPLACASVDINGRVRKVNQRYADLLGYTRQELVGKFVLALYADTHSGRVKAQELFHRFLGGKAFQDEEVEMQRADGRSVWVSLSVSPVFGAAGRVVASSAVLVDITERKFAGEMEKRANATTRALIESCLDTLSRLQDRRGSG